MDPMDIRYAWVLWIDRDERGFSSGGTFIDPRTGEILGSKTRMDSGRIRTIANYWETYMPAEASVEGLPAAQRDLVLRRQTLLTAHELGHALGFGHNFASSLNERASVMEYPTPRVKVTNGKLDLSEAFEGSVGIYDLFMARYAYTPLEEARELAAKGSAALPAQLPPREPRIRIIRAALLHYDGQVLGARLRNISSGGALVECREEMPVGKIVQLDIGVGSLLEAEVRWTKGTQFGCQFQESFNLKLLQQPPKASPAASTVMTPSFLASGDTGK